MTTRSLDFTTDDEATPSGLPTVPDILGRAGRENFRVASRIVDATARRHLLSFYGFARFVDEIGDAYVGDRIAALDWVASTTKAALEGTGGGHPLIARAAASVRELGTDPRPLFDLVEANRMDQRNPRYETFDDLLRYCTLSANPVGRLVLAAFRCDARGAEEHSDSICTGLQIVEHCADMAEDYRAGRIYIPADDWRRFDVEPSAVTSRAGSSYELRALVAFELARARRFLDAGLPLVDLLPPRLRWATAGFWAGGRGAIDRIASRDFDVSAPAATPKASRVLLHLVGAFARRPELRRLKS